MLSLLQFQLQGLELGHKYHDHHHDHRSDTEQKAKGCRAIRISEHRLIRRASLSHGVLLGEEDSREEKKCNLEKRHRGDGVVVFLEAHHANALSLATKNRNGLKRDTNYLTI